jgi:hypothetical protein
MQSLQLIPSAETPTTRENPKKQGQKIHAEKMVPRLAVKGVAPRLKWCHG